MFNKISDHHLGSACALLSAFGFGLVPIFAKYAYQGGIGTFTLIFLRFSLTALLMFIFIYIKKLKNIKLDRKQIFYLFILGGLIYAPQNVFYFSAIRNIPTPLAILIFYTYPTIVALFSYFTGEKLTKRVVISIILSSAGLVLALGVTLGKLSPIGVLYSFGAALFYSLYALIGNQLLKKVPLVFTFAYVSLFAAITFLLIGLFSHELRFGFAAEAWRPMLIITFITMFGFLAFFQGIKLTSPTTVSVLSMIEPLVAIFFSLLLFQERLDIVQSLGAVLVLSGSTIVVLKKRSKSSVS